MLEAQRFCTVGGAVVDGCVEAYAESFDYTDEYMRQQPIKRAAELVRWANVQLRMDAAAIKASEAAKRTARQRAERAAQCKAAGMEVGTVQIGMTTDQVKQCGWGAPSTTREYIAQQLTTELWFYAHGGALTFRNGKVYLISR